MEEAGGEAVAVKVLEGPGSEGVIEETKGEFEGVKGVLGGAKEVLGGTTGEFDEAEEVLDGTEWVRGAPLQLEM